MKNIFYTILAVLLLLAACEPIEIREELGEGISVDELQLNVYGVTEGSNLVVIENNTPGIGGTWDVNDEKSFKQIDTILLPYLGDYTCTFTATTDGGLVVDSIIYSVTKVDSPDEETWNILAGETSSGKTWVWAFDNPNLNGNSPWGYGAYLSDKYPTASTVSPDGSDWEGTASDEMIFDLKGAANFTLVTGNTGSAGLSKGTYAGEFKFNYYELNQLEDATGEGLWSIGQIKFSGGDKPTVSRGYSPNESNKKITTFYIISISENELVLAYPEKNAEAYGTAWYWVLKPKGYSF